MPPRSSAYFFFLAATLCFAQPAKVDFQRDIQPLFQKNCIHCHGPEQQSGAMRLDRRNSAMQGRGSVRIGPGNSEASMVFLRISGTKYGPQMPLSGPLKSEEINLIRAWIEQGAEWPDALSGDQPLPPADPRAMSLIAPLRSGNTMAFKKALQKDPEAVNRKGPNGDTPLMHAALSSNREAVRQLLAHKANPNLANDAGATPLLWALDDVEITRLLITHKADVNAKSKDGRTAVSIAAANHQTAVLQLLLDSGATAEPRGANHEATLKILLQHGFDAPKLASNLPAAITANCQFCIATLLPAASKPILGRALINAINRGEATLTSTLLEKGADPNTAEPALQTTALMLAASTETEYPEIARTLMEKGAKLDAKTDLGATALDFAQRQGHLQITKLLEQAGARKGQTNHFPTGRQDVAPNVRAALTRAIPIVQKNDVDFLRKAGCVSCHSNNLTAMLVAEARRQKWPIDEQTAQRQRTAIGAFIESFRERYLQGISIPGGQDTTGYILLGLAAENWPPDAATYAMVRYLKNQQQEDGAWPAAPGRAPLESSAIQGTATALRSVIAYKPKFQPAQYDAAIHKATQWLQAAIPVTTEDYTFQILGLLWTGNRPSAQKVARKLLAQQREDGGWAQTKTLTSDAYATGQALFAIGKAGILKPSQPAYQRGAEYLRTTQYADGSWYVHSRTTVPFQPYFESGFPHGRDQFISVAATNWAAMALLPAVR